MCRRLALPMMCAALALGPATATAADGLPARAAAAAAERERSVLIKAEPGTAADIAERHGLKVLRAFPQIGWAEVSLGDDPDATLDALNADTDVLGVDSGRDDEEFRPQFQPRDTIWTANLQIPFGGGGVTLPWNYTIANFPAAWDVTRGAASTVVGVIDSEFDTEHPDLKTKFRTGYNVNSGTTAYHTGDVRATSCSEMHGSHVAGTIGAATDNNMGTSGAGFDVTLLPVRASFNFQTGAGATDAKFVADVTEGLLWIADRRPVAVNMSFGTTRPHEALRAAINYAYSKGVTLVAAAGNDQQRQPGVAHYPASYPNVIGVAATTPNDDVSSFSSNGDYVDVAAPGEPVFSTWDNRCAGDYNDGANQYNAISGTSMAAPMVAGLVGLMKTVRPDLTPAEVETILTRTARDLGSAGRDPQFGAGRIDANAAVVAAKAYVRPVPPAPPAPPPAPPAPPAPPVATTVVDISGKPSYNRKKRTLSVKLKCPSTQAFCAGTVVVKAGKKSLGSRAFSLDRNKRTTVKFKFTAKKLSQVAKGKKKVKLSVQATARDSAGVKRTTTKSVTIQR
jgi:subtilisin family serine protease